MDVGLYYVYRRSILPSHLPTQDPQTLYCLSTTLWTVYITPYANNREIVQNGNLNLEVHDIAMSNTHIPHVVILTSTLLTVMK
jgi:hypothetical protein